MDYARESQTIVLWLWKNIDKFSLGLDGKSKSVGRIDAGNYVEQIQLLSILNLELKGVVNDPKVNALTEQRTRALEQFYGEMGFGPLAQARPTDMLKEANLETETQLNEFVASIEKRIEKRIDDIFRVYSDTLGPLLIWAGNQK